VPAVIHPGAVIHCWDHLVITLRDGPGNVETGFISLYAIAYSASLGAGHVALFEAPSGPGGGFAATLTDDLGLGARQQARLIGMGEPRAALREPPVKASFERQPYGADGFGFRITTADHEIEARWEETDPPFWVDGQNGGFHDSEDIWALMVGARRARLIVDGVGLPGAPFEDDVWTPKLGRSLSSAHGAFAEVRVQPVSGRATGSESGGPR
jgi:hypothetical protein